MERKVWVDNWQMQCCGKPFAVGDEVSWQLRAQPNEWLADILGAGSADGWTPDHGDHKFVGYVVRLADFRYR